MGKPIWITEGMVEVIHDDQIASHGGAYGLRDLGLLSQARHRYQSKKTDLYRLSVDYSNPK